MICTGCTCKVGEACKKPRLVAKPVPRPVRDFLAHPEWRDDTHRIEFRDHRGVRCHLRARPTGADIVYPDGAEDVPPDVYYSRWRVNFHDLDAAAALVAVEVAT